MPEETSTRVNVHLAVFCYCGTYYPRLCISHFNKHSGCLHHLVVHSWGKQKKEETIKETIARIKKSLLKKAAEKNEEVEKIRIVVEELEISFAE